MKDKKILANKLLLATFATLFSVSKSAMTSAPVEDYFVNVWAGSRAIGTHVASQFNLEYFGDTEFYFNYIYEVYDLKDYDYYED